MNKTLLETINLKKTYQHINGNVTLFNNLNIKINMGFGRFNRPSGSENPRYFLFALNDQQREILN